MLNTLNINLFLFITDLIPALGGKQKTEEFFMKLAHMLIEYMNKQQDRSTKVCLLCIDDNHNHGNIEYFLSDI